ncbi:hypothetical protein HDU93_001617 [Gonapodya sp. JEL0774]|nr:hypothetical protein HDU93_001617 [Gonapodya sp. JEL0774]
MVSSKFVMAAVAAAWTLQMASPALGFSNGALIPSYICDLVDQKNGSPQSLGDIVPQLVEGDDAMPKAPYAAQDLCTVNVVGGTGLTPTTTFQLSTKNPAHILVGMILWVQDTAAKKQLGAFSNPGINMIPYPWRGCGTPNQTIVHATALDEDGNPTPNLSTLMVWNQGKTKIKAATVQVRGVCAVMGPDGGQGGYGKFTVDIPVGAGAVAPAKTVAQTVAAAAVTPAQTVAAVAPAKTTAAAAAMANKKVKVPSPWRRRSAQ